jgi:hypothetical protein
MAESLERKAAPAPPAYARDVDSRVQLVDGVLSIDTTRADPSDVDSILDNVAAALRSRPREAVIRANRDERRATRIALRDALQQRLGIEGVPARVELVDP